MGDERTAEQRDADAELAKAIERCVRAYGRISPSSVITEWVVLGGGVGMAADDGGDLDVGFTLLPDDGRATPWRHLLGLIRAHLLKLEGDYLAAGEAEA